MPRWVDAGGGRPVLQLHGGGQSACNRKSMEQCANSCCDYQRPYVRSDGVFVKGACKKARKHAGCTFEKKHKDLTPEHVATRDELRAIAKMQQRFPNLRISGRKLLDLRQFAEVEPINYSFRKRQECPRGSREIVMSNLRHDEAAQRRVVSDVQAQGKLVVNKDGNVCLKQ